jgi:hypothetical protein
MHRRQLLLGALPCASSAWGASGPVEVPVVCLTNTRAATTPEAVRAFRAGVWAEAVRTFAEGGVALRVRERAGEILQYPSSRPRFVGLERGEVNVVLTDTIPLEWDHGRQVAGGSTVYEGYVVCVIAMRYAHRFRAPLLAVNTVVHELLHVFSGDVFAARGGRWRRYRREGEEDWLATRMWLSGRGAGVRPGAWC